MLPGIHLPFTTDSFFCYRLRCWFYYLPLLPPPYLPPRLPVLDAAAALDCRHHAWVGLYHWDVQQGFTTCWVTCHHVAMPPPAVLVCLPWVSFPEDYTNRLVPHCLPLSSHDLPTTIPLRSSIPHGPTPGLCHWVPHTTPPALVPTEVPVYLPSCHCIPVLAGTTAILPHSPPPLGFATCHSTTGGAAHTTPAFTATGTHTYYHHLSPATTADRCHHHHLPTGRTPLLHLEDLHRAISADYILHCAAAHVITAHAPLRARTRSLLRAARLARALPLPPHHRITPLRCVLAHAHAHGFRTRTVAHARDAHRTPHARTHWEGCAHAPARSAACLRRGTAHLPACAQRAGSGTRAGAAVISGPGTGLVVHFY